MPGRTSLLVVRAFLFLFATAESSLANPAEQILAEVNKLAPAERQKRLEEGARKEGVIKFASNESVESIKVLHGAFARIVESAGTAGSDKDCAGASDPETRYRCDRDSVRRRPADRKGRSLGALQFAGADILRRPRQRHRRLLDFFSREQSCDGIQQQYG